MSPIQFSCRQTLDLSPEEIAEQILDLDRWPEFTGYGPLPGIKSAAFEVRTPAVVGTRIRVKNLDGSSHVEEIAEWAPENRLRMHMSQFSPPLSRLAESFDETWEFTRRDGRTRVVRSFQLHAKSALARPLLWLIARFLKRAIARHLRQMAAE
ncbi:MAG: SRPBCC family protein [Pirellulaceae bacterium]